jgi:anti-anti-sigma factor
MKSSLDEALQSNKEKEENLSSLNTELENLKSQMTAFDNSIIEKENIINDLTKQISDSEDQRNYAITNAKELTEKIEDLEAHLKQFEEMRSSLDQEVKFRNENEIKISSLSVEIEELIAKLESSQTAIQEKEESINDLIKQIDLLKSSNSKPDLNNNEIHEKFESLEVELTELRETKAQLEIIIKEQTDSLEDYRNSVENLHNDESLSEEKLNEYEQKINALEEELKTIKESSENIDSVIEEKNEIIEEQGKRLSQVKLEKTDREIEFIKTKEQVEDYKNQVEKINESKNKYMLEANLGLEKIEILSNQVSKINEELEQKQAREEELNNTIEAQLEKIADLQLLIEDLKQSKPRNFQDTKTNLDLNDYNNSQANDDYKELNLERNNDRYSINEKLSDDNLDLSFNTFSFSENETMEVKQENLSFEEDIQEDQTLDDEPIFSNEDNLDNINTEMTPEKDDNLPSSEDFTHLLYGEVSVVSVNTTRATMHIASNFKTYLNTLIENGNTQIVIDLSECEFVDSTVLGVLVSSLKKAMSKEGDVRIVWGDNTESSMFYITRMDKVFKLFDNLQDAVNSYIN